MKTCPSPIRAPVPHVFTYTLPAVSPLSEPVKRNWQVLSLGLLGVAMFSMLINVETLPAQTTKQPPEIGKNSSSVASALQPLNDSCRNCIVEVVRPQRATLLGTIVTADGLVVTKLSELEQKISCKLPSGREVAGKLVAFDNQLDLALIQIEAKNLKAITFDRLSSPLPMGQLLVSAHPELSSLRLGVVSSTVDNLPIQQPHSEHGAKMGITVFAQPEFRTVLRDGKYLQRSCLRVQRVDPRGTGEAANLLVDDLICSVNEVQLAGLDHWNRIEKQLIAGKKISFEVIRNNKLFVTTAEAQSAQRTIHDLWGGSPFSERRFNFDSVIIHDSEIRPEDCGGPVFTLDGQFVGINIARALRVSSFALPASRIRQWLQTVSPNAKLQSTIPR